MSASTKKPKLFYGWIVVLAMSLAGALNTGMGTVNFGLFIRPMSDELGFGRAMFGWAFTARQLASAAAGPIIGRLLDRYGARALLALAGLVGGLSLVAMALVHEAWQMLLIFSLMGLFGISGPGALVTSVPVAKWFIRKRGRAFAMMALGTPVGSLIFLPLTQSLIAGLGWREAWIALGVICIVVLVPVAILLVRRSPEDLGLLPDGDPARSAAAGNSAGAAPAEAVRAERSWTLQEAMRSPALWQLIGVFSVVMFALGTVQAVHRIPYFVDQGIDPRMVSLALVSDVIAAGLTGFLMGLLTSRVQSRYLGAAGFCLLALGVLVMLYVRSAPLMFVSTIIFGAGVGALMFLQNFMWADYFGRAHLGSIQGLTLPINLVLGGIGAPLAGYVVDGLGTYAPVWWTAFGLFLASAVVFAFTRKPQTRQAEGAGG